MTNTILLTANDHLAALRAARTQYVPAIDRSRANAPVLTEVDKWFGDIWDQIEGVVIEAARGFRDQAEKIKDYALALLDKAQAALGNQSRELLAKLIRAIEDYIQRVIDSAIARVKATIKVGVLDLKIESVSVEQEIKMSASLKAALTELIIFVAEGTLSISANYKNN